MPTWLYFSLWLAAALVAIGFASAGLAKHLRLRELRRQQALLLLDALDCYGDWADTQRHAPAFDGENAEVAEALDRACAIRLGWFPELANDMAELLASHSRLMHFLSAQARLRAADPEAWLETDHDGRFLALRTHQHALVLNMHARLQMLGDEAPPAEPGAQRTAWRVDGVRAGG